jgi:hypothetical protein
VTIDTRSQVVRDASALSSGTIGSLIGKSNYDSIDEARYSFVRFCQAREGSFRNWVDAWHSYALIDAWPYPEIHVRWKKGDPSWREVSARIFDDQLGVLPPRIFKKNAFLIGEDHTHSRTDVIYTCFAEVNGRFFGRDVGEREFDPDKFRAEIVAQFFQS